MKKIVMMLLVLASMSVKVNAQWFVGGTGGVGYFGDHFGLEVAPMAGYEFNDRWAVGLGVGAGFGCHNGDSWGYGIINPYGRFNCWNNEKLFIDVKGMVDARIRDNGGSVTSVGFVPSLRFAINEKWQMSADLGLVGVQIGNDDVDPVFGFTGTSVGLSVIYKF